MKKRGFTLVELLIIVAIAGILAMAISSLAVLSIRTYSEQSEVSNLQTENRTTINRIKNEVLQGSEFLPTYDSRTVTINAANNSNTLIIKIPSIDNTESWIIDPITKEPKIDYFIYWTDSGDLYKKVVPDQLSTRNAEYGIISRNTEISCEYTIEGLESIKAGEESKISGADRVRITLKSSKTLRNKSLEATNTTEANLRNR